MVFKKLFRSLSASSSKQKDEENIKNGNEEKHIDHCMSDQSEFELRPIRQKRPVSAPKMSQPEIKAEVILEPGSVIRPIIDDDGVRLLVERLYGISVLEMTPMNGYDDKNYKITEDPNVKNPLITNHCPHGYVLKIINSMDSQKLGFVEAQNEVLNLLNSRSVTCPKPIRNVYGHFYSVESIGGKSHVVRLLEFVPGELLKDVPQSEKLFYQAGEFVAYLDRALQNFSHSGLEGHEHIWMLEKVPEMDKFKFAIKDAEKLELVEEVIEEFKYAVVPRLHELEAGVIHGDFNENNILVSLKPGGTENEYKIAGVLDFGDMQKSYYLFELAIAMTYMMLSSGTPKTGGYVLAGYTLNRLLPDHEYMLLKTCICARLVQSLIIGAYTFEQDPTNTYVLSTEKAKGWELLRKIRKPKQADDEDDETNWKQLADDYLTKS